MTNRVFEDDRSFEVSDRYRDFEICISNTDNAVEIIATEDAGFDTQYIKFSMTAEEATAMKEFLIKSGY